MSEAHDMATERRRVDDGGPAFPCRRMDCCGMKLRDYFAGQALARLVGLYDVDEPALLPERLDEFARLAYALADAMLRARGEHA